MEKMFKEMLDAKLASGDAEFAKTIGDAGFEKKPANPDLEVEDGVEAALNVGATIHETLRASWDALIRNHGMTDAEARRYAFLRGPKEDSKGAFKGRSFKDAVKEMEKAFDELKAEYAPKLEAKFGPEAKDMLSRIQFPQIMTRVMELPMMRPLEPVYAIQQLFRSLSVPDMFGDSARFTFPIVGGLLAHEMGEDAEVQEKSLDLAGGTMVAKFAKMGVGFRYSKDFTQFKNFDWYSLVIDACRQALLREKERKAYRELSTHGATVIDNTGRFGFSGAVVGGTVGSAGTGIDGLRNGTHVLQDIFYMMSDFNDDGMMPDTVVQSPRAWMIWAQSAELRAFAWQNGMPQLWQNPQGQRGYAESHELFGGLLGAQSDYPRGSTQYTTPPNYLPISMRIVVSPFVTSGTDSGIEYTNMHVLDTARGIGYMLQAQDVMMAEWFDPEHDIDKVRFTERYAFGVLNDSLTIRHMKLLKTREIGVDVLDRLRYNVNWAGAVGGPHVGNV